MCNISVVLKAECLSSISGTIRSGANKISVNHINKPAESSFLTCCISPQCAMFTGCFLCADIMVLPPAYPPPPVPHVRKAAYSESRSHSFAGKSAGPAPPPPPKRSLPDIKPEDLFNVREPRAESNLKIQSSNWRPNEQPPPVPPLPLFKKPMCSKESCSLPPEPLPLSHVLTTPEGCEKLKTLNLSPRTPPPVPSSKPKLSQLTERTAESKVPKEHGKPGLFVPPVLPKPPVPGHQHPGFKPRPEKPSGPQLQ